jgi:hypothetical protein
MSQDYPNIELNDAIYRRMQVGCCQQNCKQCPYWPRLSGKKHLDGLNPMVLAQFQEISVRTARNDVFHTLPDAELRIHRIRNFTATADDLRSYFNSFYIPDKSSSQ